MGALTAAYREAIDHLPDGTSLIFHHVDWDEYETLLGQLTDRPHLRVSYDSGKLEVMTPLPEHEVYARFIDRIVAVLAEVSDVPLESFGSATWKRRELAKGVEPDACYYVAHAGRIIGKRQIDLSSDPPPDLVVEIDITNESLSKFSVYAALGVREIWRYDGTAARFYELHDRDYREVSESISFPRFTPGVLAETIARSKTDGQTAALADFRRRWPRHG